MRFAIVTALSGVRIPLAGVFLFFFLDQSLFLRKASALIIIALVVSDVLDGWLARRWKVTTKFGYLLDGVADRASYIAALLAVSSRYALHPLVPYGIITRDVILYAARALSPDWSSAIGATRWLTKTYALVLRLGLFGYFALDYGMVFSWFSMAETVVDSTVILLHHVMLVVLLFSYASLTPLLRRYLQDVKDPLSEHGGDNR